MATAGRNLGRLGLVVAVLVLGAGPPAAWAQEDDKGLLTVAGSFTYKTYCATCHGKDARGDGPLADKLRFVPPDLTGLARRNGGAYPDELVHRIIDGRKAVKGHGGPDMPVWGDAFKNTESGYSEDKVREKIQGLVEFLRTIQE